MLSVHEKRCNWWRSLQHSSAGFRGIKSDAIPSVHDHSISTAGQISISTSFLFSFSSFFRHYFRIYLLFYDFLLSLNLNFFWWPWVLSRSFDFLHFFFLHPSPWQRMTGVFLACKENAAMMFSRHPLQWRQAWPLYVILHFVFFEMYS